MALSIGSVATQETGTDVLARARARAALIPDLLVEAQRIAITVAAGWHGRRRRGVGDAFWQFRPYNAAEGLSRIDWRRSARDDTIYVRDQEWEAAQTIWVWSDSSPSMLYKSETGTVSKQSRALVLALALIEVLAKSGERVGWPGVTRVLANRMAAERIAAELVLDATGITEAFPPTGQIRSRSHLVVISDFLEPMAGLLEKIDKIAREGVLGTLVQVIDPAEEQFPFTGHTQFRDPETGHDLTFGRAEALGADYVRLFNTRRERLAQHCKRLGWNHVVHHTDQLASSALVNVHTRLAGAGSIAA